MCCCMYGACQDKQVQPNEKALHVQARIAMVNTALTAAGMWALAIPGMGLLSLFVFICSFIPIAGCFISTIPVAFVALTEYGFLKVSLADILPGTGKTLKMSLRSLLLERQKILCWPDT